MQHDHWVCSPPAHARAVKTVLPFSLLLFLWPLKRLQGKPLLPLHSPPSSLIYKFEGKRISSEQQRCILLLQFSYCIIDITVLARIMYSHKVSYMKGKVKANQSQSRCWFSRLSVTNYHQSGGFQQQKLFLQWKPKPQIKMLAGQHAPWRLKVGILSMPPSFRWLRAVLGGP